MCKRLEHFYQLLNTGESRHSVRHFKKIYEELGLVRNPAVFCSDQYDIVNNKWYENENVYFRDITQQAKWCLFSDILGLAPEKMRNNAFSELIFRRMNEKKVLCFYVNEGKKLCSNLSDKFATPIDISSAHNLNFEMHTGVRVKRLIDRYEKCICNFSNFAFRKELIIEQDVLTTDEKRAIRDFLAAPMFCSFIASCQSYGLSESSDEEHSALLCVALFFCLFKEIQCYVFVPASGIRHGVNSDFENSSGGSFFWVDSESQFRINSSKIIQASYIETIRGLYRSVVDWNQKQTRTIEAHATKSAIASIMSRNGSHNIGSHVLAALSHNVGTMPDDRVLYQYIQHRMDYIATVTTELPSWAASTMFIGEMMRAFLSQHHLLEYIASSEGLKAYKFQDLNIDLRKQFETVQIHVSYGSSKSALTPVFSFDGKGLEHPIENDVALAIPGGVVGQHAFFTIVENVIRNAAKHGWSSEAEDERKKKNLEIHIDVVDDTNKDYVTFCIWDNMSSVDINCHQKERGDVLSFIKKIEKGNGTANTDLKIEDALSAAQASILIKRYKEETSSGFSGEKILAKDGALPLHWRQQVLMDQRIIHPDGSLRRENWGLAEIKISAGYLQRRTVGQMGGMDVLQGEDYIVRAIVVRNENDKMWRLGYEFKVSRPRKVLIVTANPPENISEWKYEGVHFLELSKAKELLEKWRKGGKTDAFSTEYLVVESVCEVLGKANFSEAIKDLAAVPFPFRVLAGDHVSAGEDGLTIIPFIKMEDLRSDIDWKCAKDIVSCVSETWMDYCCKRWDYDSASVRIDLNTSGNEGGAGQALISDADIWRLLFTEYFHSTLESFSDENCAEDIKSFRRCLLENRTRYKFFADDLIVIKQLAGEKLSIDYLDDNSIIARQFQYLLRPDNMIVPRNFPADKIKHELEVVMGESEATDFAAKLQALYGSYLMDCRPDINRMIRHFKLAFMQLDVMLRKYEERIVTLPHAFSILKDAKGTGPEVAHKDRDKKDDKVIIYNRHHKVTEADLKNNKYLYVEPLSGSQSYLNRLSAYSRHDFMQSTGDQALIKTQLIENALMRILIVDERVSRFLRSHDKSRLVFRAMNIWCLDETGKTTDGCLLQAADKAVGQLLVMTHNADSDEDKFSTFLNAAENAVIEAKKHGKKDQKGPFDILIIHQGILDKWCKDAASVTGMETIIDKLKEVVDYVVITTGRGTPANIPPCTRILPFSTIESTLFKLYPEKMTLVDSIMNILPLGGIRK